MGSIEPPRPKGATRTEAEDGRHVPEPPTDRALWPTFMRRTIEETRLRRSDESPER